MSDDQTRVLLIEDNNIQARATQTCLEQEHDVVVETSVEDAHARFDAADFDLIIALIGDSQARMDSAS